MSKKLSHKLDLEIKDQFGLNYHILEKEGKFLPQFYSHAR